MADDPDDPDDGATAAPPSPGPLSRLLQDLARAPDEEQLDAWKLTLRPGDAVGRFEVLREIGRGGFGVVYEALDRELGRTVALKTLRASRTRRELAADWIHREAEAVARLDHPGIVTLHEYGRCDAGPYLVEELLRGKPLEDRMRAGPLPPAEAAEVARQAAAALGHAHARGVCHRDLKPANVFITEDGRVKLLDFGLAHLLGTREQSGAGTPAYMAPEQARGGEVGPAADVFSLGAVLFEMLAGHRPFDVRDGRSAALADGPAPALSPRVPAPLARLVRRCLDRDPARRPPGGEALHEELRALQPGLDRRASRRRSAWLVAGGLALGLGGYQAWRWLGPGAEGVDLRSQPAVAVLPFVDLSPEGDQRHFAEGTAEEILDALARIDGLRVAGRTSAFSFQGRDLDVEAIGRQLRVNAVVEGTVRRLGDRVRVTARLVQVRGGFQMWSQVFDRRVEDVFAIQDEIAAAVAGALEVRLLPGHTPRPAGHRSPNLEAYDRYLRGRRSAFALDCGSALREFRAALALDERYAAAWAGLASCMTGAPGFFDAGEDGRGVRQQALEAAERAIALAPDLAEGYAARGSLRRIASWDWDGARGDLQRSLDLDGRSLRALGSYAMLLAATGREGEAVSAATRLVEVEPLSSLAWAWLGTAQLAAGLRAEARASYRRALELSPSAPSLAEVPVRLDLVDGRPAEALAQAERLAGAGQRLFYTALAEHDLGHREASERARLAFEPAADSMDLARLHAWRGEADAAFAQLERACAERHPHVSGLRIDPLLVRIRGDPRWPALLSRLGLPAT